MTFPPSPLSEALFRTQSLLRIYYPGWNCSIFAKTGSTNDDALAAARSGKLGAVGSIFLAYHQDNGRGTHGRRWSANPGEALLATCAIRRDQLGRRNSGFGRAEPDFPLTLWPLLIGLALTLRLRKTGYLVSLKWPNDLMLDDGKVGGILCELIAEVFVVGFGVNLTGTPQKAAPAAAIPAALAQYADRGVVPPAALVPSLVQSVVSVLEAPWPATKVVEFYTDWCWSIGKRCSGTNRGGLSVSGVAFSVSPDGALVIEDERGERHQLLSPLFTDRKED